MSVESEILNNNFIQRLRKEMAVDRTEYDRPVELLRRPLHEVSEATMMARGLPYDTAHASALAKYGVSPFSAYHPEVIAANPSAFNSNWFKYWGIGK